ncbi:MAG: hypothetical protein OJI67_08610 [Prosthecobacter sp.]|nr:hypothetical protein [Prosthecobacter sp.]
MSTPHIIPPAEIVADTLRLALDQVREFTVGLNTEAPKFDAVLGCLTILARLDLTVMQAHVLLCIARQPDRPLHDIATDVSQPVMTINDAVANLFARKLVLIPFGGAIHLTPEGENVTTVIISCTALAEASNALRRMQAARTAVTTAITAATDFTCR